MKDQLTHSDRERYRRQLMLTGFTASHQRRLRDATVLVAGVGGLGGTAAVYLAAAGIGRMVLVHAGNLTLSNMNRQILMKHSGIGTNRVAQAKKTILEMNPDVAVVTSDDRITDGNAPVLLRSAQIALSARPNFQERRALNKACIQKGIPLVEAAMNGMEGYLFNVIPGVSPCMHCVYPEDDPSWQELAFPVLGAVSGMLGCIMALECIKLLTGYGKPLLSQMLLFNTTDMVFRKVRLRRNSRCKVCASLNSGVPMPEKRI